MYYLNLLLLAKSAEAFTGLQLMTDQYPTETSWQLRTYPAQSIVDSRDGGYYTDPNNQYMEAFSVSDGQYIFEIFDAAGDGICCSYGDGYYNLLVEDRVVYNGDGQFGSSATHIFTIGAGGGLDGGTDGLSPGSILIIIFIVVFACYCIFGYIWNTMRTQHKDWSAVKDNAPHFGFWTVMLWKYTKAGCVFSYEVVSSKLKG